MDDFNFSIVEVFYILLIEFFIVLFTNFIKFYLLLLLLLLYFDQAVIGRLHFFSCLLYLFP